MKNKGFTLIELLAVVVILAIIAGVAYPIISSGLERSRKSTFLSTYTTIIRDVRKKFSLGEDYECSDVDSTNKCFKLYNYSENDYVAVVTKKTDKVYISFSPKSGGNFSSINISNGDISGGYVYNKSLIITEFSSKTGEQLYSYSGEGIDDLIRNGLYDTDKTINDKKKIDKALDVVKYKRLRDDSDNTDYCESGYKLYSSSSDSTIAKNAVNVVKNDVTGAKKYYYKNYIDEKTPNFCYYYWKSSSNAETYDIFFCMNDKGEYGNLKKINGKFVLKTPILSEECKEEDEEGNCIDYSILGYNENKYSLDLQSYCYENRYPQN